MRVADTRRRRSRCLTLAGDAPAPGSVMIVAHRRRAAHQSETGHRRPAIGDRQPANDDRRPAIASDRALPRVFTIAGDRLRSPAAVAIAGRRTVTVPVSLDALPDSAALFKCCTSTTPIVLQELITLKIFMP